MQPTITHYTVTSAAASKAMDRMDRNYGAVICTRRAHWSDEAA